MTQERRCKGPMSEVAADAPDGLMREEDTVHELAEIGFEPIEVRARENMTALLVAQKAGVPVTSRSRR